MEQTLETGTGVLMQISIKKPIDFTFDIFDNDRLLYHFKGGNLIPKATYDIYLNFNHELIFKSDNEEVDLTNFDFNIEKL